MANVATSVRRFVATGFAAMAVVMRANAAHRGIPGARMSVVAMASASAALSAAPITRFAMANAAVTTRIAV
jgi:hypothetical protein